MANSQKPSDALEQASLWTMTAAARVAPLGEAKVDLSVSKEQLQRALAQVKKRTAAFSGEISVDVFRTIVR
jgi:hypothetical protein